MLFPPRASERPLPAVTLWDVILLLVIFMVVAVVLASQIDRLAALFGPEVSLNGLLPLMLLQSLVPILLVHLLIVKRRGITWADLGFRPADPAWYRLSLAAGLLCVPLVAGSRLLFEPLFGEGFENPQVALLSPDEFTWTGFLATLFVVAVLAPLIEEILFRGLLFPLLRRWMRFIFAALISGLCFALLHQIVPLIPAFLIMGIVLAAAREYSGSLWPPLIIHGLFNALNVITLYTVIALEGGGF